MQLINLPLFNCRLEIRPPARSHNCWPRLHHPRRRLRALLRHPVLRKNKPHLTTTRGKFPVARATVVRMALALGAVVAVSSRCYWQRRSDKAEAQRGGMYGYLGAITADQRNGLRWLLSCSRLGLLRLLSTQRSATGFTKIRCRGWRSELTGRAGQVVLRMQSPTWSYIHACTYGFHWLACLPLLYECCCCKNILLYLVGVNHGNAHFVFVRTAWLVNGTYCAMIW